MADVWYPDRFTALAELRLNRGLEVVRRQLVVIQEFVEMVDGDWAGRWAGKSFLWKVSRAECFHKQQVSKVSVGAWSRQVKEVRLQAGDYK